ncbi:MAG: DUF1963 domain-containing protein [Phycisphaeraceae bacterium]|nr:DUF1963 domain-containing protein [Phycisphaeraceae bacterium]
MPQIHERFDLPRWTREFNLAPLQDETRQWAARQTHPIDDPEPASFESNCPLIIDGPRGLAAIETIRAGLNIGTLGPPTPADVFVWALGEPAHPAATKIGGVPYRPAASPWPSRAGRPMGLLAQFCFADSLDLALTPAGLLRKPRPLPGDVLLIFAPGDYLVDWDDDEPDSLHFEWQPLGLQGLVRPEDVPPPPVRLNPTHAQIHRTADYHHPPDNHPIYNLYDGKRIALLRGSKIGGVPAFGHTDPRLPGRHLCTLGSLNPHGETFPLLNVPNSPDDNTLDKSLLMLADMGMLYLFIDKNGKLHWIVQGG